MTAVRLLRCAQAIGIALVSLKHAEFMKEPRKVCQVSMPMYKPEAHGQLLKLAKVPTYLIRPAPALAM